MFLQKIMKWVANHIRLAPMQILVIALLCSCGSSKKAEQLSSSVKAESSVRSEKQESFVRNRLVNGIDQSVYDIEVHHEVYDADQKVVSRTTYKKSARNEKRKEERGTTRQEAIINDVWQAEFSDSVKIVKAAEKNESTIPRQIGIAVKWVCILIGLLIVWYLMRRYGRR